MSKIEYKNIIAFHPGYYIADVIEDLGMTQAEFASRLDITPKNLSELIHSKTSMSNKVAKNLSAMLGTSVEVWLELQKSYDARLIEIEQLKAQEKELTYLKKLDYSFFQTIGRLKDTKNKSEQLSELYRFLKISALGLFESPNFIAQFRRTELDKPDTDFISNVWVQTIFSLGTDQTTDRFSGKELRKVIKELRAYTHRDPNEVLGEVKEKLSRCGVALIVIPSLARSGVFGATKWIDRDKAVIGLSDRRKTADTFWFSLFHELAHVLDHKTTQVYILSDQKLDEWSEEKADEMARDLLIPPKEYENWLETADLSASDITAFAKRIDIHPGIVVGRLQKDEYLSYAQMNSLKMPFIIDNRQD